MACLRAVAQGRSWMQDSVFREAIAPDAQIRTDLTPREHQVMELVEQGFKNREIAMKMLRARLFERKQMLAAKQIDDLKGQMLPAEFGSQIRNYTLQPYTLVKDVRTEHQTAQVNPVLDGDIDEFIQAYLRMKAAKENKAAAKK